MSDLNAAVAHYDDMRATHSERSARLAAEGYLRRKVHGITADDAAIFLADALAIRAQARITSAQAAILQGSLTI